MDNSGNSRTVPLFLSVFLVILSIVLYNVFIAGRQAATSDSSLDNGLFDVSDAIEVIGVVRSSGLGNEEKAQYGLQKVEYQVTDFDSKKSDQILGFFLQSDKLNETFVGKCAKISGVVPDEWKTALPDKAYGRSVLNVITAEKINFTDCNPPSHSISQYEKTQKKVNITGILLREKRPSPDIGYDYVLHLTSKFIDTDSVTGSPAQVNSISLVPVDPDVWFSLENNIGREVSVEGYNVWGYAETKHIEVTSAENLSSAKALELLRKLSEIKQIESYYSKHGRTLFFLTESQEGNKVTLTLKESFPEDSHTVKIGTFIVDVKNEKVTALDPESGKEVYFSDWVTRVTD